MARNQWPTKSKGVFYSGYQNPGQGPERQERDSEKARPTAQHRVGDGPVRVQQASEEMTEQSMRIPHPRRRRRRASR